MGGVLLTRVKLFFNTIEVKAGGNIIWNHRRISTQRRQAAKTQKKLKIL